MSSLMTSSSYSKATWALDEDNELHTALIGWSSVEMVISIALSVMPVDIAFAVCSFWGGHEG